MDELSNILETYVDRPVVPAIQWLKKQFNRLTTSKTADANHFFMSLYSLLKQGLKLRQSEARELVEIAIRTFFSIVSVDPNEMDYFDIKTKNGILFEIALYMNTVFNKNQSLINSCREVIKNSTNEFSSETMLKNYYSIPPCYYISNAITILQPNISQAEFEKIIFDSFSLSEVIAKKSNYHYIVYLSHIIKLFKSISKTIDRSKFSIVFKAYYDLFSSPNYSASNLLSLFFQSWIFYIKQFPDAAQQIDLNQHYDIVTRLFEKVSISRYHELHRSFSWHLVIYLYPDITQIEQKHRTLTAVCNAVRSAMGIDSHLRKCFQNNKTITDILNIQQPWEYLFIVKHLSDTINAIILSLQKFTTLTIIKESSFTEMPGKERNIKFISFTDQTDTLSQFRIIEDEIFTKIVEKVLPNDNSALLTQEIETHDRKYEEIKKRIMSAVVFLTPFVKKLFEIFNKTILDNPAGLFSQERRFVTTISLDFMKLAVFSSYGQFIDQKIKSRFGDVKVMNNVPTTPRINYDINQLISQIFFDLHRVNPKLNDTIARTFVQVLCEAQIEGYITLNLINTLTYFANEYLAREGVMSPIVNMTLSMMTEQMHRKLCSFISAKSDESKSILEWTCFTIRLAYGSSAIYTLSPFINSLITYSRILTSAFVLNVRRITSQINAWKLVLIFSETLKDNIPDESDKDAKARVVKSRVFQLDEMPRYSYEETLPLMLKYISLDDSAAPIQYYSSTITAGLNSDNIETVRQAAKLVQKLVSLHKQEFIDDPELRKLPKLWMAHISESDPETAAAIYQNAPDFAENYLSTRQEPINVSSRLTIKGIDLDMYDVISAALDQFDGSLQNATHLLSLFVQCIDSLKSGSLYRTEHNKKTLTMMWTLIEISYDFKELVNEVKPIEDSIITTYGNLFVERLSNIFILSLFEKIGGVRSSTVTSLINLSTKFIEYFKEHEAPESYVTTTINQMVQYFLPKNRNNSLLCGLTQFVKFYPHLINMSHIRILLSLSSEIHPLDIYFPTTLSGFLKLFLDSRSSEEKDDFIRMYYDIGSTMNASVRHVLNKRIYKMDRKIILGSDEDLHTKSSVIFMHRITLMVIASVGVENILTDDIRNTTMELIARKDDLSNFEKLSQIVTFCWALSVNPAAMSLYFDTQNQFTSLMHYLVNSFTSRYPLIRGICRKAATYICKVHGPDHRYFRYFIEYIKQTKKIFQLKSPERISFYRRLMKVVPDKVPPEVTGIIINEIVEYTMKPIEERFKLYPGFQHVIHTSTVRVFLELDTTKRAILGHGPIEQSLLKQYLHAIITLFNIPDFPVVFVNRKKISRMLQVFPRESIEILLFKDDLSRAAEFLYEMISADPTDVIFNTFIGIISGIKEPLSINPFAFTVLRYLAQNEHYQTHEMTLILQKEFASLMDPMRLKKYSEHIYTILTDICYGCVSVFRKIEDPMKTIKFCQIFQLPHFANSDLYRHTMQMLFDSDNQMRILQMIDICIKNFKRMPMLLLSIVIPRCMKALKPREPSVHETLWKMLDSVLNEKPGGYVTIHGAMHLIKIADPPADILSRFFVAALQFVCSRDPTISVLALKFLRTTAELGKMPPQVFYAIAKHCFFNLKFFELPYSKYVFGIFRASEEYIEDLPDSCVSVFLHYAHNKFDMTRELSRFGALISQAPGLNKYIPFSFISGINIAVQNRLRKNEANDIVELFKLATSVTKCLKPTMGDIQGLLDFAIQSLTQRKSKPIMFEICNLFGTFVLENGYPGIFSRELLDSIKNDTTLNTVVVVSLAVKFQPEFFHEPRDSLIKCVLEVSDNDFEKVSLFFKAFIHNVFADKRIINAHIDILRKYIKTLLSQEISSSRKAEIVTKAYIGSTVNELHELAYNQVMRSPFRTVGFMMSTLKSCVPLLQNDYAYETFLFVTSNRSSTREFIRLLPGLISSSNFIPDAKCKIIDLIASHGVDIDPITANRVVDSLEQSSKVAFKEQIIKLIIIALTQKSFPLRFKGYGKLGQYLPDSKHAAFSYLMKILPPKMWSDKYMATVMCYLHQRSAAWISFVAIGNGITKLLDKLSANVFIELINEGGSDYYVEHLEKLLEYRRDPSYRKILSGLTRAIKETNTNISFQLADRAIRYTGDDWLLPSFYDKNVTPRFRLFKPHCLNDTVYSFFTEGLCVEDRAAAALSFLGQYQASSLVFALRDPPERDFMKNILELSHRFFKRPLTPQTSSMFLTPLRRSENQVDQSIESLYMVLSSLSSRNEEKVKYALEKVQEFVVHPMVQHPYSSTFEIERTVTISAIQRSFQSPSEIIDLDSIVNPTLSDIYESLYRLLTRKQKPVPIAMEADPILITEPRFINEFGSYIGYTSKGLLALGYPQVQNHLETMTEIINYWIFSAFCFNMFALTQQVELYNGALNGYTHLLSTSSKPIEKATAADRILTLCDYHPSDANVPITALSPSNLEAWQPHFRRILEFSHEQWFTEVAGNLFIADPYRALVCANECGNTDVSLMVREFIPEADMKRSEAVLSLFNCVMDVGNEVLERRRFLSDFVYLLGRCQSINFSDNPTLKRAALFLRPDDLEKLGNLEEIKALSANKSKEECVEFVTAHFGFPSVDIDERVSAANTLFPFPIRRGIDILTLGNDIRGTGSNFIITCATSAGPSQRMRVWRASPKETARFDRAFGVLRMLSRIVDSSYATRVRGVRMNIPASVELEGFVLSVYANASYTLERVYREHCARSGLLHEKEEPVNVLRSFIAKRVSNKDFLEGRPHVLRSFCADAVARVALSFKYQRLQDFTFCLSSATVVSCVDSGAPVDEAPAPFRLSPSIAGYFGPNGRGEVVLGIGAVARSVIENIEAFRASIEAIICGELQLSTTHELLENRNEWEKLVVNLAPVSGQNFNGEDASAWLLGIEDLIDAASSLENPAECIPWF